MQRSTRISFITIAALAFPVTGACAPSNGSESPFSGNGGARNGVAGNGGNSAGPGAGGSTTAGGGTGVGGDGFMVTGRGGDSDGSTAGCGVTLKPEQIIQQEPVGIFIMQDRSGSMVTGYPPPASPDSWDHSTAAVTAFVSDPASTGISVGLGSFPPIGSAAPDCTTGTNCGTPIVPIAALPANATPMITAMQTTAKPDNPIANTPTECGIRGMISQCEQWHTANNIKCVNVLVTDGTPTECDTNDANLIALVSSAKVRGYSTFVIGLPGSNIQALEQLAQAGGTTAAIDVSAGVSAFVEALNKIRSSVSVGSALPCQWKIPPPPDGQTFDPNMVNISFTPQGGTAQDFGYVVQADCARATNVWYFDDASKPTQVFLCSKTCDMLKASTGAEISVSFGCKRKDVIFH